MSNLVKLGLYRSLHVIYRCYSRPPIRGSLRTWNPRLLEYPFGGMRPRGCCQAGWFLEKGGDSQKKTARGSCPPRREVKTDSANALRLTTAPEEADQTQTCNAENDRSRFRRHASQAIRGLRVRENVE